MEISLAPLTLGALDPLELVAVAGAAGYDACGLGLKRLFEPLAGLLGEPGGTRATLAALERAGVKVSEVSNVVLEAEFSRRDAERIVGFGAGVGAPRVQAVGWDPEPARAAEHLAELADLAAGAGMDVVLEFMPYSHTRTLGDAVALVRACGRPNVAVLLDALHLVRSGGTVTEVEELEPGMLGMLQLCDGPLEAPDPGDLRAEAIGDRRIPGEGEFPLRELLAVAPGERTVSLEVPNRALADRPPTEWAAAVLGGFRRVLDELD